MYGIAVLNKHLTPTLEEELHRCKYLWIIMVLPVNGLIEDFLMGKKNKKKKTKRLIGSSNLSTAFTAVSRHHSLLNSCFSYFHFLNNFHS